MRLRLAGLAIALLNCAAPALAAERDALAIFANIPARHNGISVPVLYAGPPPDFAVLDPVNAPLALPLRGAGQANVVLAVDRQTSNAVMVKVQ
jgi:uncharacterized protein (TIGR03437 family)